MYVHSRSWQRLLGQTLVKVLWDLFSTRPQPWPIITADSLHKWFYLPVSTHIKKLEQTLALFQIVQGSTVRIMTPIPLISCLRKLNADKKCNNAPTFSLLRSIYLKKQTNKEKQATPPRNCKSFFSYFEMCISYNLRLSFLRTWKPFKGIGPLSSLCGREGAYL